MIRFLLVLFFVAFFLVGFIPLLIAEWIIGKFNMDLKNKSSLALVKFGFRVILLLSGTRVIVKGEEHVPKDKAVVYVGNHRSFFDIIITYVRVPRPTGYIAKKEMLRYPLLLHWMKNLHCLFLDRDNVKEGLKTILTGIEKLKSGISICIFPEGTRNKTDQAFLPFHDGSFKLAEKSGAPIIPMTMVNTSAIFEDHLPKIKKATVILEYGQPVYMKDLDKETKKNIGDYVQGLMSETYFRNLEELKSLSQK